MIQSFDTQLQVTMRALREVVAPAMDTGNKAALEQLHLSIATLAFMQQRLPYARRFCRMELQHLIDVGGQAAELIAVAQPDRAQALRDSITEGRAALLQPQAENEDYQRISRALRERMSEAVAASAGQPQEARLDALIVGATEFLLPRERVWGLPLGMELQPDSFASLDQLLGSDV